MVNTYELSGAYMTKKPTRESPESELLSKIINHYNLSTGDLRHTTLKKVRK